MIKINDYVTRKSHNNDIIFQIVQIDKEKIIIKGVDIRLIADAPIEDLVLCDKRTINDDFNPKINDLNRDKFFYIPGFVLHIDSDKNYIDRCLEYYKDNSVPSKGVVLKESEMSSEVIKLLKENKPDILVLTGHDAYLKNNKYKNSEHYIKAVKEARKYELSKEKLIIISGACQSNYEGLIKAGSTFASSPKKINIHALDPAIIASSLSLYDKTKNIELLEILNKTKYKSDGIGGLITKGTMYTGYPRNEEK